ncbi:MAG: hypothetical protein KC422_10355 [Trueperaceae bacterium]|nr:hypothetical protein [Trueperaceae bacterium]
MKKVVSHKGVAGYGLLLSLSGFAGLALIAVIDHATGIFFPLQFSHTINRSVFFTILFLGLSPIILWLLTLKVSVNKSYLISKSLFGRREIPVVTISEISISNGTGWIPFSGYNLILYFEEDEGMAITNTFFWNSHNLTKAILEVAINANPSVSIDPVLIDTYGFPPYGIFTNFK